MHVSTMVRRSAALLAVLVAAAACSDAPNALAPREHRDSFDTEMLSASKNDNQYDKVGQHGHPSQAEKGEATLIIDPRVSRSYAFGPNTIYFPAYSICDPVPSGYGPLLWDAPCQPLAKKITVNVKWSGKGGHGFVKFEPDLRFAPAGAHETSRWVILSMYDRKLLNDVDNYSILYVMPNGTLIDESLTDRTLCAWTDKRTNTVFRRIKHFSGYMVSAGFANLNWGNDDVGY